MLSCFTSYLNTQGSYKTCILYIAGEDESTKLQYV